MKIPLYHECLTHNNSVSRIENHSQQVDIQYMNELLMPYFGFVSLYIIYWAQSTNQKLNNTRVKANFQEHRTLVWNSLGSWGSLVNNLMSLI